MGRPYVIDTTVVVAGLLTARAEAPTARILDAMIGADFVFPAMRDPGASGTPAPDLGDAHLWALLDGEPEAVLVTGDKALLERPPRKGSVCTPAVFVASVLDRDER